MNQDRLIPVRRPENPRRHSGPVRQADWIFLTFWVPFGSSQKVRKSERANLVRTSKSISAYLSVIKWLLLLLIPSISYAQTLKPGVYRDLKVEKPIVLDTGSYTFINLQMKNLGKGVWLDGRKASRIELQHCRFEGKRKQNVSPHFCRSLTGTPFLVLQSL